jgi:hypothetical protein
MWNGKGPGLFIELARHRVVIRTSRVEGLPNIMLQAVSAGTPVLSLSVDPDKILERYGAGFICSGSMDEMVRRCVGIVSDAVWERCHEARCAWRVMACARNASWG